MRRRKSFLVIVASILVLAAIIALLVSRGHAPPEAARLLPAADAYVYVNVGALRSAGVFQNAGPISFEADYDQFVRETGFQFERDLDTAAFAAHIASAPDSTQPEDTRYSEVFTGRFDRGKIVAYLKKLSATTQRYRNLEIYAVPLPGRTVRLAFLNEGTVGASNTEGPYALQGMIDRYQELAWVSNGPDLVRQYYPEVPLGSVGWIVSRTGGPGGRNSSFVLPGGYNLFVPAGTVVVAAVRYLGAVQFRAEALARTEEDARRLGDQLGALLALTRALETSPQSGGNDPDVKAFFDSITLTQTARKTELSATIPKGFVKKLVAEAPSLPAGSGLTPEKKPQKHGRKTSRAPSR
ncbi:MAG: hypothetical protein ACR2IF_08430 [Terriglobales bacterium]